jgi:hypothetical protein
LGRAGASRRARTHRFPAVINRVSETPALRADFPWILCQRAPRADCQKNPWPKKLNVASPHTPPDTPNERRHG